MLDSATREAAPRHLPLWLGQRTRWMKGWMQTFIVHNRDPHRLMREMGLPAMLAFEALVLGMIVTPILHCVFTLALLVGWALGIAGLDDTTWTLIYLAMLALGYGSSMALTVRGLLRLNRFRLLAAQLLLPFYWLLTGIATIKAARELMLRPFHWFKSPHRPSSGADAAPAARPLVADLLT